MMAIPAPVLPVGDGWSYEVKWDGYRTLALKDGARVRLFSRNLKDVTAAYPSVARTLGELRAHSAVVDGELVAVDDEGRPSFQALHHQSAHTVVYYAFDILQFAGRDLTREPLDARRLQLAAAVTGTSILVSEPLPGTPAQIEQVVRELGLEGVVAKRHASRYEAGRRSNAWLKVKFSQRQEFVVGGYKPANAGFDSVLVGYYDRGRLYYASKVRAGFTPHSRRRAHATARASRATDMPVRQFAERQDQPLGRGNHGRRHGIDRVDQARDRRRGGVHRMDEGRQLATRVVCWPPRRQVGARRRPGNLGYLRFQI